MAFGLLSTGFRRKRVADIKIEIENALRATLGQNINLLPQSLLSQFVGIFSEREGLLWELAESVYNSQYPDTAEGVSLDNVSSLSGIVRLGAVASRILNVHLFGDVGTTIPAGTAFSVQGSPSSRFQTLSGITLVAGQDAIQEINFPTLPISGNFTLSYRGFETSSLSSADLAADIQAALNALPYLSEVVVTGDFTSGFEITFQGADGKIDHELIVIASNTLQNNVPAAVVPVVTQTQQGIPQGLVDVEATETGPIVAPAYTLTEIETPVTGLDSVLNTQDEIIGRNIETDTELRIRRLDSLQRAGSSTVEAIRARLLEVQEVGEVVIFENVTEVTDINGLPAKSFKAFVQGGDEQEIADALWLNKPAGIRTVGDITRNVTDSQGVIQTINFSRPVEVEIYINIEVTRDTSPTSQWPVNAVDLIKEALAGYVNSLTIGSDVIVYPKMIASLNSIPGLEDIEIGVGETPAPPIGQDDNIVIAINEIALISDLAQITVTVLP